MLAVIDWKSFQSCFSDFLMGFFYITAKLLVTTGWDIYDNLITTTEVLDLSDRTVTCQQWVDHPIGVVLAIGGYKNDSVITCGGTFYSGTSVINDRCFKMEPSKATEIGGLELGSRAPGRGGGIFKDSLLVSGGNTKNGRCKKLQTCSRSF